MLVRVVHALRIAIPGAGLAGAQLVLSAGPAWAAQPEHDHMLNIPVSIGPLVLRVGLLVAVPAVAGFAMLRGFLAEPSRSTAALVAGCAAVAVLLEFMLAGGMDFPRQVVVLVLVALALPLFAILSRDPRFDRQRGWVRGVAPWVVSAAAALALAEFVRALLGLGDRGVLVPTGVVLALVGLSWFTVCGTGLLVRIEAALLGNAVLAGSAYALALTLPQLTAAAP